VHENTFQQNHGRTGRKKLGGRKEICPTFPDCARVVKKNFPEKLSKIVVDGGGRSYYEKFLLDSIFPTKLTEFHTEFVPFIFIISQYCPTVKRILPDWLCLPNKPPPGTPMNRIDTHTACNADQTRRTHVFIYHKSNNLLSTKMQHELHL
jgi:hypothetical protein